MAVGRKLLLRFRHFRHPRWSAGDDERIVGEGASVRLPKLFVLIPGGISFGVVTPNEAGGIGAIGSLDLCDIAGVE